MLYPLCLSILLLSECIRITDPGALVPETADVDAKLPSVTVSVAGRTRTVHCRNFGESTNPVLLVVHGSLSDMRPYLPLQLLAERYRVVFWDMRGNGLSERVSREELSYANMVEEFHAIKQLFSPHRKAAIIAHSWSAVFGAIYLGKYPEDIEQAVLMEPFGLRDTFMNNVGQALNLGSEGYMDMMYSSELITPREHESLDFRMLGMLTSGVRDYFCDRENPPDWPVWRVGGLALLVWEKALLDGTAYHYDFTTGAENYDGEVLFAGSSCSPIGYAFQEKCNQRVFRNAHVLRIEDCGHRLVTEQFDVLVQGLKGFLREYRRGAR